MLQIIWRLFLYLLAGYIILCITAFFMQRNLLYLPGKHRISEQRAQEWGLSYWPSSEDYRGLISQATPADPQGTVIVFHGNAGAAADRLYYVEALANQSLRVILAEYPGYGAREGKPGETLLVEDALDTIRLAYQAYGEPLYLWGESLGCGVVSGAVARTEVPIKGIALFLAYDSMPDVAQTHYWYLPARWLLLDRYNNIANLQGYSGNIAVILAGNDEVIPVVHGIKLYDSLTTNKNLWIFEGATHNQMPVAAGLSWWKEVITFIAH